MHVIAKEVGVVSSNNGERLGESKGIHGIFVDFQYVRNWPTNSELLLNNSLLELNFFLNKV